MTNIYVQDLQPQYEAFGPEPVNVWINGFCNHAEALEETEEFESAYNHVLVYQQVLACTCGAYKLIEHRNFWENETEREEFLKEED